MFGELEVVSVRGLIPHCPQQKINRNKNGDIKRKSLNLYQKHGDKYQKTQAKELKVVTHVAEAENEEDWSLIVYLTFKIKVKSYPVAK